jgi:sialate O-acetylesterase
MMIESARKTLRNIRRYVITVLFLGVLSNLNADVKMPSVFGDSMVLQRDMPVPIWGWADKGEAITVSFNGQKKTTITDENGKWHLKLDSLKSDKTPKQMTITGNNKIVIKNILVGDVWLCSGQSNMQW